MKRLLATLALLFLSGSGLWAQVVGDQTTAGYENSRTYLNSNQGDFSPPFFLSQTVPLTGRTNATSLLVFQQGGGRYLLVGEGTAQQATYQLYNADNGVPLWSPAITFAGNATPLHYTPGYTDDVVILGGPATSTVKAVRVSSGAELWEDAAVRATSGRHPVATNGLAIYSGQSGVKAVHPEMGPDSSFWELATTTARAPISFLGDRVYVLEQNGTLRAVSAADGSAIWNSPGHFSVNPNIVATEGMIFLNTVGTSPAGAVQISQGTVPNQVKGLSAVDGSTAWSVNVGQLSETPALALAYQRLFVFSSDTGPGEAAVTAHDPETGELLWATVEDGPGIDFASVANNLIIYYHQASQRIRARNAFTGNLVWSHQLDNVQGLSLSGGSLYVLLPDEVQVFSVGVRSYMAHYADGMGQRTIISLSNPGPSVATGAVTFFSTEGALQPVALRGLGTTSNAIFSIPAFSSIEFETLGGEGIRSGWIRVSANRRVAAIAIFQYSDAMGVIQAEAGVAESRPTGQATVYTLLQEISDAPLGFSRNLPLGSGVFLDTAVAGANVGNETASIVFELRDILGSVVDTREMSLDPGHQFAQFVDQLFPESAATEFRGSITIRSDVQLIMTALRTLGGLQLSSYPVGQ